MRRTHAVVAFMCAISATGCTSSAEPESGAQIPEVYEEVLAEYWDQLSARSRVSACDFNESTESAAAFSLLQGLGAEFDLTFSEQDVNAWMDAAQQFLKTKCGSGRQEDVAEADARQDAGAEPIDRLELWVEFHDTANFTSDGEDCLVRHTASRKRAFVEGRKVTLVDGDGRRIASSQLRPSFHRPTVMTSSRPGDIWVVGGGDVGDWMSYPCVVRAVFENVAPAEGYGIRFTGSDLMHDVLYSPEDLVTWEGRLAAVVP